MNKMKYKGYVAHIHTAVAAAAKVHGKSINQWASEILDKAAYI